MVQQSESGATKNTWINAWSEWNNLNWNDWDDEQNGISNSYTGATGSSLTVREPTSEGGSGTAAAVSSSSGWQIEGGSGAVDDTQNGEAD